MTDLRVTASALNLRTGPGTDSPVRLTLPRGTRLAAIGPARADGWRRVRLAAGTAEGWVASRYTAAEAAPWMPVAEGEVGVREVAGHAHSKRVLAYHASTELRATSDEVPWCSSFVNWCMRAAGYVGTDSAAARSWLSWGVPLLTPQWGCVVVLKRGDNPTSGHVGFFVGMDGDRVRLLGGNQGNAVCTASFPTARVLSYRWPSMALRAAA